MQGKKRSFKKLNIFMFIKQFYVVGIWQGIDRIDHIQGSDIKLFYHKLYVTLTGWIKSMDHIAVNCIYHTAVGRSILPWERAGLGVLI